ncbi:MAG TPA: TusE/DsrC/DsvC family sulfur relay protein [Gemmatimonadaceae bacterium]|nr:TusE/DsrC/DsvC family sulfur relay protein [Gemmatimonadaceae bacterium]
MLLENGVTVERDAEGFLKDHRQWTRAIGEAIAAESGITMTPDHWKVVMYMRDTYTATGAAPTIRTLGKDSGVDVKRLYQLFPKGPAKLAARIAGIPKPHGCI